MTSANPTIQTKPHIRASTLHLLSKRRSPELPLYGMSVNTAWAVKMIPATLGGVPGRLKPLCCWIYRTHCCLGGQGVPSSQTRCSIRSLHCYPGGWAGHGTRQYCPGGPGVAAWWSCWSRSTTTSACLPMRSWPWRRRRSSAVCCSTVGSSGWL